MTVMDSYQQCYSETNDHVVPQWALDVELVYVVCIMLVGIPGNGIILLVEVNNNTKSSTDHYVLTMAIVDLVSATLNSLMRIFLNSRTTWCWMMSSFICSIRSFFIYTTSVSSVCLLAAIAVDRYIQTCRPLNTFYTKRQAKFTSIALIITGLVCSIHSINTYYINELFNCAVKQSVKRFKKYMDVFSISITIVGFIVISIAYLKVSVTLFKRQKIRNKRKQTCAYAVSSSSDKRTTFTSVVKSSNQVAPMSLASGEKVTSTKTYHTTVVFTGQSGTHKRTRYIIKPERTVNKTTKIMFLITLIFFVTWLVPWLRVIFGANTFGLAFNNFARSTFMINNVSNPIIFCCMSSRFRAKCQQLLKSWKHALFSKLRHM